MAQPDPYERDFEFESYQSSHPSTPLPGDKVDAEFDLVATAMDAVLARIANLQRDDLALANKLVGYDQLADELRNGFTTPTVWAASTAYGKGAGVYVGRKVYAALSAHTSGSSFNVDLTAGKWYLLADFTAVTTVDQTASEAAALAVSSASAAATSAGNSQTSATAAAASESAAAGSAMAAEAAQTAIEAAQTKLDSIEEGAQVNTVASVAGETGAIAASALRTALNVEDGADVTDATNVAAAGAVMEGDTTTASMSFVIDEDDMASDSATKLPTQQSVNAAKLQKAATRTAMKALSLTAHPVVYLHEGGRKGHFNADTSDLSAQILGSTTYTPASINATDNTLTFSTYPGLLKGYPVYVTALNSNTDLTAGTIYWVWRSVTNYTDIKLCATFADAIAGTNFIDLTDTTHMPSFKVHKDPAEGMFVIPTGKASDGSQGAFVRSVKVGASFPEWFGAKPWNATDDDDAGFALQMTLNWSKFSLTSGSETNNLNFAYDSVVDGRYQVFKTTIPLNDTGWQQANGVLRSMTILGACAGKIVLDTSNANTKKYIDVQVLGHFTDTPSVGILNGRANDSAHTNPMPSAASNEFVRIRMDGYFTKACYVNPNGDLSRVSGKMYNRYRGTGLKTTTLLHCALYTPIDDYIDGLTSEYQEIIDASDTTAIGTTLDHVYDVELRRPFAYSLTPSSFTKSGTVLTAHFGGTYLLDNGISNGDPVFFTASNLTFELPRDSYTLKNIDTGADTAEIWVAGGASAYDATSVTVANYTTGRITNDTGPSLVIGGFCRGISLRGYILGYSPASAILDLQDGDINRLETVTINENAQKFNWRIVPHASLARAITEWTCKEMGDLVTGTTAAHITKDSGGTVTLKNFTFRDAYQQTGTANFPGARLFGGSVSEIILQNVDISVSSTTLLNTLDASTFGAAPTGKVFDAQTGKTSYYPKGTYSPTLGGVTSTNLDSAPTTSGTLKYWTVGSRCYVQGLVTIDPTATGVTTFDIPLPITSNLIAGDLFGTGIRLNNNSEQATIQADATNDCATVSFSAVTTTSWNMLVQFNYEIK